MISTAVQRSGYVYAYNERKTVAFSAPGELVGFTGSTVSIKRGGYIYVYNEKGTVISSHPTR